MIANILWFIKWIIFGGCRHRWRPWSEPMKFGFEFYQDRSCLHCNKRQQRKYGFATHA